MFALLETVLTDHLNRREYILCEQTKVYTIAYAVKFTKTTRCRKVFMRIYHHDKIQYNNYICNGRQHKVKCGLKQTEKYDGINSSRNFSMYIYPWIFWFYSSCSPKWNISKFWVALKCFLLNATIILSDLSKYFLSEEKSIEVKLTNMAWWYSSFWM